MKWYLVLIIVIAVGLVVFFPIALIIFRNKVIRQKESIENAKSHVRILKAKYLQVLRKVGTTQRESNDAHGSAYYTANKNGAGRFIGGAIGPLDSNFEEATGLVVSLANDYQSAQQRLNDLVNGYNVYITAFPRIILTKILGFKKESYVDSGNLSLSTKISGFDDNDI